MKKNFEETLQDIAQDEKNKKLVSVRLVQAINNGSLVLSAKQKALLYGQIKLLLAALEKDVNSIDVTKKPANAVWGIMGPVPIKTALSECKADVKSVKDWASKNDVVNDTRAMRALLQQIEPVERAVKTLKSAQNQNGIINWFCSRFPIMVR